MDCSAARKMTVSKPNPCQMLARATETREIFGSESHPTLGKPRPVTTLFSRPLRLYSITQMVETTTSEVMTGR